MRRATGLLAIVLWSGCSSPTPPSCVYTLSTTAVAVPPAGGNVTVVVTAGSACTWTAVASASWLTVTSGSSGTGDGTVIISAGANGQTPRTATLTIAGRPVSVSQDGAPVPTFELLGKVTDWFIGPPLGLAGVSVTIVGGPSQGAAVTDAGGIYAIPGLLAGTYTVTFVKPAYLAATATVAVSSAASLSLALALDVPAEPSISNLTGYWSGTGTYPNAPFKLALVQEGGTIRGLYVDQHDVSSAVSGAYAYPDLVLRVNFGDAVLFLECAIEDDREINGVQRTSALGNRPYSFTMKR